MTIYDDIVQSGTLPDEQTFCAWMHEHYKTLEQNASLESPESVAYHTLAGYADIPLANDPTLLFENETYIDVILEMIENDLAKLGGTERYRTAMREAHVLFYTYKHIQGE